METGLGIMTEETFTLSECSKLSRLGGDCEPTAAGGLQGPALAATPQPGLSLYSQTDFNHVAACGRGRWAHLILLFEVLGEGKPCLTQFITLLIQP